MVSQFPTVKAYEEACARAAKKGIELTKNPDLTNFFNSTYYFFMAGDHARLEHTAKQIKFLIEMKEKKGIPLKKDEARIPSFLPLFEILLKKDKMKICEELKGLVYFLPPELQEDERHYRLLFSREYLINIKKDLEVYHKIIPKALEKMPPEDPDADDKAKDKRERAIEVISKFLEKQKNALIKDLYKRTVFDFSWSKDPASDDGKLYFPLDKKSNALLLLYFFYKLDACIDAVNTFTGKE
ncbi:MAG: hypothetical protein ABH829_05090 [archaeon]